MKLAKMQIHGFRSFQDSGLIEFDSGINLIIGQNNTGKSVILRASQHDLPDDRHRNLEKWKIETLPIPNIFLEFEMSGEELSDQIHLDGQQHHIPVPPDQNAPAYAKDFLAEKFHKIAVYNVSGRSFQNITYPGHGKFRHNPDSSMYSCLIQPTNGDLVFNNFHTGSLNDTTSQLIHNLWSNKSFYFSAERMSVGECHQNNTTKLSHNASNLPAVLATMIGEQGDKFNEIVKYVRQILPTVGNISVRPKPYANPYLEILIWPTEKMNRAELSFPLNSSGTGVSQVLAILAAITTVENAVILIDEINSFLHPAAVKALLRILQSDYNLHQYILSTHSMDVISFSNPKSIYLVSRNEYVSKIKKIDLNLVEDLREIADQIGVSMSDVFAAERVIWVEGPTEELCFPILYEMAVGTTLPRGTLFSPVIATGDFIAKKRDRKIVYEIYNRLSSSTTPLLRSVLFSFDSEELSDIDKAEMIRESKDRIRFLPRRHLECYFVNADILAQFIVDRAPETEVSSELVKEKLCKLAGEYGANWGGDLSDKSWLANVDAARLIKEAVSDLSECRVTFNKKKDTLALLQYSRKFGLDNSELTSYVKDLVIASEIEIII